MTSLIFIYPFLISILLFYPLKIYFNCYNKTNKLHLELQSKINMFNIANKNLNLLIHNNSTLKKQYEEVINYGLFSDC
jgi:hypothetical protein